MIRHGVCYVFNLAYLDQQNEDILKSYSSGEEFGLTLILNLESMSYMRYGLSKKQGFKISITEPYAMPELLSSIYRIGR